MFYQILVIILFFGIYTLPVEGNQKLTPALQTFIENHPVILMGTGKERDPYIIKKTDGTVIGYDKDILELVNRYTGANFVLKVGEWSQIQQKAKQGTLDGLAALIETPQRQKWLDFSQSYTTIEKIILMHPYNTFEVSDKQDLSGRSIVIQRGNVADEKLAKSLHMKIDYADTQKACFQMVLDGKVEMTIGNSTTNYLLGKLGLEKLQRVYTFKNPLKLKFAVRKELSEAKELLNIGLRNITKAQYKTIEGKWFSWKNHRKQIIFTPEQRAYLRKKEKINMCVNPNKMPFEHINKKGLYEGILSDYRQLFSEKLGLPFVLVRTKDYNESKNYLKQGLCDIIMGDIPTDNLKESYLITTDPYLNISGAFVTHTDATIVHQFSQIVYSGKIGVLQHSPAKTFLPKRYPDVEIVTYTDSKEALKAVSEKNIIAFVNALPAQIYAMQKLHFSNIKIAGIISSSLSFSILVNKNQPKLVEILNQIIKNVQKSERKHILDKWVQIKYNKSNDYAFLYRVSWVIGIVVLLILFLWYNTHRNKKKILRIYRSLEKKMQKEIAKNREQQLLLLQQNRLAQKGEMLNMIAHQWRQPLNALSIVNQMFTLKCEEGTIDQAAITEFENKSKKLIQQMSDTIDDFKNFFQSEKYKVEFVLDEMIKDTLTIIQPLLADKSIELDLEVEEGIIFKGYLRELGQALINIIANAKDALVMNVIEDPYIKIRLWKESSKIYLTVTDNAGGIPEKILPKIFDPYFSTKDEKNGMGIGLYMSKIIIEEHISGELKVENREKGASFLIILTSES